jgi:type I restriction-modification system DNA methylase subunit
MPLNSDGLKQLEANLWQSADTLRANSDLKSSEYATPVLGLIFLKFADNVYRQHEAEIQQEYQKLKGGRREKPIAEMALAGKAKQGKSGRSQVDRLVRALKATLEELHCEVKSAESFFGHVSWLQERFSWAKY